MFISKTISHLVGVLLPAYYSFKSIEAPQNDHAQWLTYWVVYGLLQFFERSIFWVVLSYIPYYWEIKIVFLLVLMSPQTRGATVIYKKLLEPFLVKHEKLIDETIEKTTNISQDDIINGGIKLAQKVKQEGLELKDSVGGTVRRLLGKKNVEEKIEEEVKVEEKVEDKNEKDENKSGVENIEEEKVEEVKVEKTEEKVEEKTEEVKVEEKTEKAEEKTEEVKVEEKTEEVKLEEKVEEKVEKTEEVKVEEKTEEVKVEEKVEEKVDNKTETVEEQSKVEETKVEDKSNIQEETKVEEKKESQTDIKAEEKPEQKVEEKVEPEGKTEQEVEKKVEKVEENVEEKPKVEDVKKEEKKELKSETLPVQKGDGKFTVSVPSNIHKYCIGQGGSVIKKIGTDSNSRLNSNTKENLFEIITTEEKDAQTAASAIQKVLEEVGWYFVNGKWEEHTKQDELWSKFRGDAEREVKLRNECFEQSKKAFDSGDKELAKELSDKAKAHGEKWKQLTKDAAQNIFNEINKNNDEYTIDLHGLFVDEAMGFVTERLEKLKGQEGKKLSIITGAGNHSKDKALIKPKVIDYLKENSLKFEEVKNGEISVQL